MNPSNNHTWPAVYVPDLHIQQTKYYRNALARVSQTHQAYSFLIIYPHYALLTEHFVTDVLSFLAVVGR
jgi:hypothetical protein